MENLDKKKTIRYVFLIGIIFSFQVALTTYINSTLLSNFTDRPGLFYSIASFISITGLLFLSRPLNLFGNKKMAISLSIISMISLLGIYFSTQKIPAIFFFILYLPTNILIFFTLDIFLEKFSDDSSTGLIRGTYLSIINIAWLIAPMTAGLIMNKGFNKNLYIVASSLIVIVLILIIKTMAKFKDEKYIEVSPHKALLSVFKDKDIKSIYWSGFLLQFFYACMTIFMPLYLHTKIGFSWIQIGAIFTFMLLPFSILERPLGRLADKKWGEKEMLLTGFFIISIATIIVSLIKVPNPFIFAIVLFISRIGAATIEVMNDSYFFKHTEAKDTEKISFFRTTAPFAYIIAPLIATLIIGQTSYNTLFFILGSIMLSGIIININLKDTK